MTGFLVSVKNIIEARIAMESDADIIDLKDPASGALGGLPIAEISQIVAMVNGRKVVSATIGDLIMDPELIRTKVLEVASTGVDIVKVGFFDNKQNNACVLALKSLADDGIKIVAVLVADQNPDFSLLKSMSDAGFYGVMLDTATKNGRSLPDYVSMARMHEFVTSCHSFGMISGLAGSLAECHVEGLISLNSDYLGFRGGLCVNSQRTAELCPQKIKAISVTLQKCNTCLL